VLYSLEALLTLFGEVGLRRHEELLAKDDFVLVGKFEGSFISKLVVGDGLVPVFEEMAVLVLHFPHYLLS